MRGCVNSSFKWQQNELINLEGMYYGFLFPTSFYLREDIQTMTRRRWTPICALALLALSPMATAQFEIHSLSAQAGITDNPYTTDEDADIGAKVFRKHCATCHGRNAEGFRGPNLTTGRFRHGSSDSRIFRNILEGIAGTGMGGVYLPDTQIWQVITYVRSLSGSREEVDVPGDPKRGRQVFEMKGECSTCHRVGTQGGRRGTDLSSVGWMRSVQHIREAILDPSKEIAATYRFVQLDMNKGDDREGIVLNEDTYSIQLMNEEESLVSIAKADITEIIRPQMSLMPEFLEVFTNQELTDLIAYLHSLHGEDADE